jgi:glycosyltransferase involved in cell wall biosynthesis
VRVLIISPYPIWPPVHGGRVRTLGLARGLARAGATVAILCPWVPWNRRREELEPRLSCSRHLLACNLLPATPLTRVAPPLALLSLQPRLWGGPRRWLSSFSDLDVVQLEFCAQARWMDLFPPDCAVCYSAHNVERDFLTLERGRYLLPDWSLRRIDSLERSAVERSDLVVASTDADLVRLREIYGEPSRSLVVSNGIDPNLLSFVRRDLRAKARAALDLRPGDRVALFVGSDAPHNREAVDFIRRSLAPHLPGDVRILIAGRCARRSTWPDRRGRSLGFHPDLRPLFAAADVGINPVAYGTGSNVKLAEYLAAGLPVVSTPVGARGLQSDAHGAVRVAPRERFAEALGAPLPAGSIDGSFASRLSWDALGAELLGAYRELRRDRSPRKRLGEPRGEGRFRDRGRARALDHDGGRRVGNPD